MSALDDLKAAGFSDEEVSTFAAQKRDTLKAGGFSDDEVNAYLGAPAKQPDMLQGNKTFARSLWDRFSKALEEGADQPGGGRTLAKGLSAVGSAAARGGEALAPDMTAKIEAGLNAGSGFLFGFPAQVAAGLGGLVTRHVLGMDVDPAALAEGVSKAVTYTPQTKRGIQLTGQVNTPFELLGEGATWSGHKATDLLLKAGAGDTAAAAGGAITEQTLGLLPMILLGEFGRKMGGQRLDAKDMTNAAKVAVGPDAPPAAAAAAEASLHATYEKTGIGPYTVLEAAKKDPTILKDLADPAVEVPKALEQFVPKAEGEAAAPTPGDGLPLLDTSEPGGRIEPTFDTRAEAADLQHVVNHVAPDAPELAPALAKEGLGVHDVSDAAQIRAAAMRDPEAFNRAAAEAEARPPEEQSHADPAFNDAIRAINEPDAGAHPGGEGVAAEQPSGAGFNARPGAGTLNAGINPAAVLGQIRDSYTPFVGVEQDHVRPPLVDSKGKPKSPLADDLLKVFSPASRGEAASMQAGIMRANLGEMARQREVALERLKETAAGFDKLPVAENIKFIDAMEKGTPIADKKLAKAAESLRALLDAKRDEVQALGTGKLENFDENYFPHIWKDADQGTLEAMYSRRPLAGSGSFLKERTIPYTTDGLKWRAYDETGEFIRSFDSEASAKAVAGPDGRVGKPLTPITTNPVELALLKAREMDRYIYGQHIFEEMKAADLARFVGFGERPPPGWTKINDKIARVLQKNEGEGGGMILRGDYYAPDEAATLINNHLSPGLQGNTFFDAWRGIGSMMNSAQLGLSLFHVGFTTMDSMISKVALGLKQISRGDIVEGAGNALQGVNPAQPFINLYKGDKLLQAYLGKSDSPELSPIVDAIQQAGGRVKMDDFYRNTNVNAFKQALRRASGAADAGDYKALLGASFDATKAFLPTVMDRVNAPIFEYLVPRQKLGVFFDMAKDWLAKNPDASVMEKREGLGKLWDSVDNRMGQLVYDNVFWDHRLKDALMATVRSVGWNLGTFRELGGGVLDVKNIPKDKALTDRTAYLIALPLVASIYGAVTQYAMTGEAPKDMKDAFYPRTGATRPDGSPDRVSLPSYMKDVFAYGEDIHNFGAYGADPTQTLQNKAHPLISTVSQMLANKDFFGGAIRNPADSMVQQMIDEAAYLRSQASPFSIRNYLQQAKLKGEEPTAIGYLTSPSMVGIVPAPGYITKSPEQLESAQVSRMRDPLIQKYREAIKNGMDPEKAIPEMIKGGLSRRDIRYVLQSSRDTPRPGRLKSFKQEED